MIETTQRAKREGVSAATIEGRSTWPGKVTFGLVVVVLLSGILSWGFVPAVRVLGYQTILIVGPKDARKWSIEKLEGYGDLAIEPLVIALKDKDGYIRGSAALALDLIGQNADPALAEKTVRALSEALRDEQWMVHESAKEALKRIQKK
jgi:HEAT repeat protein